jgi:signal transduction histidine kinase
LSDALRELCERIDQTDKAPRVHFNTFGLEQRLPQTHEQLLYRVVQELMTNILKYADASEISLNLVAADGELNIMLEDDGRGFDPLLLMQSSGHGWANVQSRLDMLRAEIDVDSRPERKGSTFSITLATS